MRPSHLLWTSSGVATIALVGFGVWLSRLASDSRLASPPPIPTEENDEMLAALRPPRGARPLVATVAINDATETTDYVMPVGILRRANVADVVMLSTERGAVKLFPALTVEADATIAAFDARHPEGADYVIVPAMSRDDDPAALEWIRSQARKGATIIGVCAGAKVVGAAGLLDGRRATTHWYYLHELLERSPRTTYVPDRRIVVDGRVATTTGVSASMPMTLMLIEAIAGRERAESVARELGVPAWDARHYSAAFALTRPFALTVLGNRLAFWRHEERGLELSEGMDEVSLALVADAWSRTYRSRAVTFAATAGPVRTANGLRILPDETAARAPDDENVRPIVGGPPAAALDRTLDAIGARYGAPTADVVAMQLEYPRR